MFMPIPMRATEIANPEMDAAEIHAPLPFDRCKPLCRTATRYFVIGAAGSVEVLEAQAKSVTRVACAACKRILATPTT